MSNMLNTMKRISKKPYEMIRRKVAAGKVAGADETEVKNGQNPFEVLRVIHCGPCAGIASLLQSLLTGEQGHRPMAGVPE